VAKSDGKHHSTKKSPEARNAAKRTAKEDKAIKDALTKEARRLTMRRVK